MDVTSITLAGAARATATASSVSLTQINIQQALASRLCQRYRVALSTPSDLLHREPHPAHKK